MIEKGSGWRQFLQILNTKALRAGCLVVAVNPNGTSQKCSDCGATVSKTLSDRWHSCQCGASYCRDHNAARNIKHRAAGHPVLLQSSAEPETLRLWSMSNPLGGVT
ncbi:MAG: transposase [Nostoc sp.]